MLFASLVTHAGTRLAHAQRAGQHVSGMSENDRYFRHLHLVLFLYQKFITGKKVDHDRDEENMDFRLGEDFYRYPDAEKKRREEKQKLWDWVDDHEDELSEEWKVEDSTTKDVGGLKVWSCTVKTKGIKKDGDNDWKVVDIDAKLSYKFSKINDKWKMVR